MEKSRQESIARSEQLSSNDWKDTVSKIRHHSTEDNKIHSEITQVTVDEETARINMTPEGFDKTVECRLDASVDPEERSPFERFIDNLGYNISEDDLFEKLQGQECLTTISRSSGSINVSIDDSLISKSEDNERNKRVTGLLVGYFLGALPLVNLIIIYSANMEIINKRADRDITESPYFLTGFATSMTAYAFLLPYAVATL